MPVGVLYADIGVVGVMEEVRGVLVKPPSLCCGGTVTVIGVVMGGAVRGMGSDTEITTLVGAEGSGLMTAGVMAGSCIEDTGAAEDCCGSNTCCGIVGSCGGGTTNGSWGCTFAEGTSCGSCWAMVSVTVARGLNMLPYMLDMLYPIVAAIMFGVCLASCCCSSCCCRNGYMLPAVEAWNWPE